MKKLFILLFVISAGVTLAQGGQSAATELNVQIFDNWGEDTIDFIMEPIIGNSMYSTIYKAEGFCNFPPLSALYVNAHYPNVITLTDSANYCIENGWQYSLSTNPVNCDPADGDGEAFQSGLYKVTVKVNNVEKTNFLYDNRHSIFPGNPCSLQGFLNNDIGVRYDVDDNKLYHITPPDDNPSVDDWIEFKKGEVINWWELGTSTGTYSVVGFQTRYFAILNEPVEQNESPYLTWAAPNVSSAVDHYEVQRSWNGGNFNTIYSTSGLSYLDEDITMNEYGIILIQYRIATVYVKQNIPYSFSNIRKTSADNLMQKANSFTNNNYSFSLEQNYPNPFNPTTTISYQVGMDGYVALKVFNLLGEEVAVLVNQQQQKGNYEVRFSAIGGSASGGDAYSLPSGIYIYRLTVGGFNSAKKLILTK